MILYDAGTHPGETLLPDCERMVFIDSSTPDAKNWNGLTPWLDKESGKIDMPTLEHLLGLYGKANPGRIVSMNVEHAAWPRERFTAWKNVDIEAYKKLAVDFALAARRAGLRVGSPFEAIIEGAHVELETRRLANARRLSDPMHGLNTLIGMSNDALEAVHDVSDVTIARVYAPAAFSPMQVKQITRRNVGEARRLGKGKPLIAVVWPATLNEDDMKAQVEELMRQRVDGIALWYQTAEKHGCEMFLKCVSEAIS